MTSLTERQKITPTKSEQTGNMHTIKSPSSTWPQNYRPKSINCHNSSLFKSNAIIYTWCMYVRWHMGARIFWNSSHRFGSTIMEEESGEDTGIFNELQPSVQRTLKFAIYHAHFKIRKRIHRVSALWKIEMLVSQKSTQGRKESATSYVT